MTRHFPKALATIVVAALAVSATWAQGRWGGRGGGRGCGARWSTMSQEDLTKVNDLHQKIRTARWELYTLQQQDAGEKKIEQKTEAIERLRDQLHKVMEATRPDTCPLIGQQGVAPGAGYGRGWMGGRRGWGAGGGFGRGMGRMGGMCPFWSTLAPQSQPTQ